MARSLRMELAVMHESALGRYGVFSVACFVYAVAIFWMLFRRRITLQSSLTYLLLMLGLGVGFVVLLYVPELVPLLGFTLPANLFFAVAIATLAYLHLTSLVAMSRLEERSTTLIQELALLREKLDQVSCREIGNDLSSNSNTDDRPIGP